LTNSLQETSVCELDAVHKDVWDTWVHAIVVGLHGFLTEHVPSVETVDAVHEISVVNSSTLCTGRSGVLLALVLTGEAKNELCADAGHTIDGLVACHLNGAGLDAIAVALIFAVLACDLLLKALVETFSKEFGLGMAHAASVPAFAHVHVVLARSGDRTQFLRGSLGISVTPGEEIDVNTIKDAFSPHKLLQVAVDKINAVWA